jgi:hypothetical protein
MKRLLKNKKTVENLQTKQRIDSQKLKDRKKKREETYCIINMPPEILDHIFSFIKLKDICTDRRALILTCKYFKNISTAHRFKQIKCIICFQCSQCCTCIAYKCIQHCSYYDGPVCGICRCCIDHCNCSFKFCWDITPYDKCEECSSTHRVCNYCNCCLLQHCHCIRWGIPGRKKCTGYTRCCTTCNECIVHCRCKWVYCESCACSCKIGDKYRGPRPLCSSCLYERKHIR